GRTRGGVADSGGRTDRGTIETAVLCPGRADAHRLVGKADVHCVGIGGRMDRDGLDAHFVARAVDAQRELAAIGDEKFLDAHGLNQPIVNSGWSNSTGWLFSTCTA